MKPLVGVVTAMAAEAKALLGRVEWNTSGELPAARTTLADGTEIICVVSGIGPEKAERAAGRVIKEGASEIVSVGIAGGLTPDLCPGDVIIGDSVVDGGEGPDGDYMAGSIRTDLNPGLAANHLHNELVRKCLVEAGLSANRGIIVTVSGAVLTGRGKQLLHERTGAMAVDMESYSIARTAVRARVPFLLLRVVCDPAERTISPHLTDTLGDDGKMKSWVLLGRVLSRPGLIPHLFELRSEFNAALKSLGVAWKVQAEAGLPGLIASVKHRGSAEAARVKKGAEHGGKKIWHRKKTGRAK